MLKGRAHRKVEPRAKLRVRRGDQVVVIAGKDKGASGKVLRVIAAKGRVVVEGVNLIKRHTRPNPQKNVKGGIVEREAPIHASKVMPVDPETGKATRVRVKLEGGKKVRVAKSGAVIVAQR